jgi:hypothetical protein
MHDSSLDRREFTRLSLIAMFSGVAITISGCGGGGSGSPTNPTPTPSSGDKAGAISANHGHSVFITNAQLTAGGQVVLTLQGTTVGIAEHTHTVQLTAAQVVSIRDGARVAMESSTQEAHDHIVTFN